MVSSIFSQFDQSGRATEGLAFVSYANENHAETALEAFNGASAKGQPIGVSYAFTMPPWVRSALGIGRNANHKSVPVNFGLLGRIQNDRTTGRHHFTPYDTNRLRGPRASFPPHNARGSTTGRDSRRATDSLGGGIRHRGSSGLRSVGRGRGTGERHPSRGAGNGGMKSARELDKELEAFMGTTSNSGRNTSAAHVATDVQMVD